MLGPVGFAWSWMASLLRNQRHLKLIIIIITTIMMMRWERTWGVVLGGGERALVPAWFAVFMDPQVAPGPQLGHRWCPRDVDGWLLERATVPGVNVPSSVFTSRRFAAAAGVSGGKAWWPRLTRRALSSVAESVYFRREKRGDLINMATAARSETAWGKKKKPQKH